MTHIAQDKRVSSPIPATMTTGNISTRIPAEKEPAMSSSFSKNFGLYRERTGALTAVAADADVAQVAMGRLKVCVRTNYSNPPAHGGLIVKAVLSNEELERTWRQDLEGMCSRIKTMRSALVEGLAERGIEEDFSYIKKQRGMFSFSGLSDDTVAWLKTHKSIYVVGGGRINVAGLTTGNINYVCDSIAESLRS